MKKKRVGLHLDTPGWGQKKSHRGKKRHRDSIVANPYSRYDNAEIANGVIHQVFMNGKIGGSFLPCIVDEYAPAGRQIRVKINPPTAKMLNFSPPPQLLSENHEMNEYFNLWSSIYEQNIAASHCTKAHKSGIKYIKDLHLCLTPLI